MGGKGPRTATTLRPRHDEAFTKPCYYRVFEVDSQGSREQPLSGKQRR